MRAYKGTSSLTVVISATGLWAPPASISNAELVASFNTYVELYNAEHAAEIEAGALEPLLPSSVEFIEKASGIKHRYVLDKEGALDVNRMVPRILERRFCMRKCGSIGDCRDGYECRDVELMMRHGGEPVPDPTDATGEIPSTSFCATRQACINISDCETNETCDPETRTCAPL